MGGKVILRRIVAHFSLYVLVCFCALSSFALSSFAQDVEVAFSPYADSLQLVLSSVNSAKKSIEVAAYSFTSKPISVALLTAYRRGVDVKIVADKKSNSRHYSAISFLANQGVPTRLNGKYAILHDKFMVIDHQTVETGSFNFTAAAVNRNAENVLVLQHAPNLAAQYTREWERLWAEGEDVTKQY